MTTSLVSDFPSLVGRQDPQHLLCDDGDLSQAVKAITLAQRIGKRELPWQEATTRGILTLGDDGLFTHPTCVVIAPRQNGKTLSAAELRIIFGLFSRGEKIVYSAQRWLTAESIFKRIKRAIESRPSLKRRVVRWTCSQGQASIELESGAVCAFITRSLDAGRGFDEVDVIIYDESYNLKDAETSALSPTQLASVNPQTIYLSSAVNQEVHASGQVLANLRHRALTAIKLDRRAQGLYFAEYMAPEPPPDATEAERRAIREDPATWRLANPSYGVIQSEAKVRKLLTELSPKAFEVEVLGWGDWPPVGDASTRPIPERVWTDLADSAPALLSPYPRVVGVDRTPMSKVWAVAGSQRRRDGGVHLEVGFNAKATVTDMVAWIVQLVTDADPIALVIDQKSPAMILVPYLIAAGIEPVTTNTGELTMACGGFLEAADAELMSHSGQKVLDDSIAALERKELPGGFVWKPVSGGVIAPAVAATVAHWGLLSFDRPQKTSLPPMAAAESGPATAGGMAPLAEFDAMAAAF